MVSVLTMVLALQNPLPLRLHKMVIKIDPKKLSDYKLVEKSRVEEQRRQAYQKEADPMFFMVQRGEATLEEWQAKVQEIKARFPYPEV